MSNPTLPPTKPSSSHHTASDSPVNISNKQISGKSSSSRSHSKSKEGKYRMKLPSQTLLSVWKEMLIHTRSLLPFATSQNFGDLKESAEMAAKLYAKVISHIHGQKTSNTARFPSGNLHTGLGSNSSSSSHNSSKLTDDSVNTPSDSSISSNSDIILLSCGNIDASSEIARLTIFRPISLAFQTPDIKVGTTACKMMQVLARNGLFPHIFFPAAILHLVRHSYYILDSNYQLRLLQTLSDIIATKPAIFGESMNQILDICFRMIIPVNLPVPEQITHKGNANPSKKSKRARFRRLSISPGSSSSTEDSNPAAGTSNVQGTQESQKGHITQSSGEENSWWIPSMLRSAFSENDNNNTTSQPEDDAGVGSSASASSTTNSQTVSSEDGSGYPNDPKTDMEDDAFTDTTSTLETQPKTELQPPTTQSVFSVSSWLPSLSSITGFDSSSTSKPSHTLPLAKAKAPLTFKSLDNPLVLSVAGTAKAVLLQVLEYLSHKVVRSKDTDHSHSNLSNLFKDLCTSASISQYDPIFDVPLSTQIPELTSPSFPTAESIEKRTKMFVRFPCLMYFDLDFTLSLISTILDAPRMTNIVSGSSSLQSSIRDILCPLLSELWYTMPTSILSYFPTPSVYTGTSNSLRDDQTVLQSFPPPFCPLNPQPYLEWLMTTALDPLVPFKYSTSLNDFSGSGAGAGTSSGGRSGQSGQSSSGADKTTKFHFRHKIDTQFIDSHSKKLTDQLKICSQLMKVIGILVTYSQIFTHECEMYFSWILRHLHAFASVSAFIFPDPSVPIPVFQNSNDCNVWFHDLRSSFPFKQWSSRIHPINPWNISHSLMSLGPNLATTSTSSFFGARSQSDMKSSDLRYVTGNAETSSNTPEKRPKSSGPGVSAGSDSPQFDPAIIRVPDIPPVWFVLMLFETVSKWLNQPNLINQLYVLYDMEANNSLTQHLIYSISRLVFVFCTTFDAPIIPNTTSANFFINANTSSNRKNQNRKPGSGSGSSIHSTKHSTSDVSPLDPAGQSQSQSHNADKSSLGFSGLSLGTDGINIPEKVKTRLRSFSNSSSNSGSLTNTTPSSSRFTQNSQKLLGQSTFIISGSNSKKMTNIQQSIQKWQESIMFPTEEEISSASKVLNSIIGRNRYKKSKDSTSDGSSDNPLPTVSTTTTTLSYTSSTFNPSNTATSTPGNIGSNPSASDISQKYLQKLKTQRQKSMMKKFSKRLRTKFKKSLVDKMVEYNKTRVPDAFRMSWMYYFDSEPWDLEVSPFTLPVPINLAPSWYNQFIDPHLYGFSFTLGEKNSILATTLRSSFEPSFSSLNAYFDHFDGWPKGTETYFSLLLEEKSDITGTVPTFISPTSVSGSGSGSGYNYAVSGDSNIASTGATRGTEHLTNLFVPTLSNQQHRFSTTENSLKVSNATIKALRRKSVDSGTSRGNRIGHGGIGHKSDIQSKPRKSFDDFEQILGSGSGSGLMTSSTLYSGGHSNLELGEASLHSIYTLELTDISPFTAPQVDYLTSSLIDIHSFSAFTSSPIHHPILSHPSHTWFDIITRLSHMREYASSQLIYAFNGLLAQFVTFPRTASWDFACAGFYDAAWILIKRNNAYGHILTHLLTVENETISQLLLMRACLALVPPFPLSPKDTPRIFSGLGGTITGIKSDVTTVPSTTTGINSDVTTVPSTTKTMPATPDTPTKQTSINDTESTILSQLANTTFSFNVQLPEGTVVSSQTSISRTLAHGRSYSTDESVLLSRLKESNPKKSKSFISGRKTKSPPPESRLSHSLPLLTQKESQIFIFALLTFAKIISQKSASDTHDMESTLKFINPMNYMFNSDINQSISVLLTFFKLSDVILSTLCHPNRREGMPDPVVALELLSGNISENLSAPIDLSALDSLKQCLLDLDSESNSVPLSVSSEQGANSHSSLSKSVLPPTSSSLDHPNERNALTNEDDDISNPSASSGLSQTQTQNLPKYFGTSWFNEMLAPASTWSTQLEFLPFLTKSQSQKQKQNSPSRSNELPTKPKKHHHNSFSSQIAAFFVDLSPNSNSTLTGNLLKQPPSVFFGTSAPSFEYNTSKANLVWIENILNLLPFLPKNIQSYTNPCSFTFQLLTASLEIAFSEFCPFSLSPKYAKFWSPVLFENVFSTSPLNSTTSGNNPASTSFASFGLDVGDTFRQALSTFSPNQRNQKENNQKYNHIIPTVSYSWVFFIRLLQQLEFPHLYSPHKVSSVIQGIAESRYVHKQIRSSAISLLVFLIQNALVHRACILVSHDVLLKSPNAKINRNLYPIKDIELIITEYITCLENCASRCPVDDTLVFIHSSLLSLLHCVGHLFSVSEWPSILSIILNSSIMLSTPVHTPHPGPYSHNTSSKSSVTWTSLIDITYQSVELLCTTQFLSTFDHDSLCMVFRVVGSYGLQIHSINVALSAISQLLSLADFLASLKDSSTDTELSQGSRKPHSNVPHVQQILTPAHLESLWLILFEQFQKLGQDDRSDVRGASINTLFRVLTQHFSFSVDDNDFNDRKASLSPTFWKRFLSFILFPMLYNAQDHWMAASGIGHGHGHNKVVSGAGTAFSGASGASHSSPLAKEWSTSLSTLTTSTLALFSVHLPQFFEYEVNNDANDEVHSVPKPGQKHVGDYLKLWEPLLQLILTTIQSSDSTLAFSAIGALHTFVFESPWLLYSYTEPDSVFSKYLPLSKWVWDTLWDTWTAIGHHCSLILGLGFNSSKLQTTTALETAKSGHNFDYHTFAHTALHSAIAILELITDAYIITSGGVKNMHILLLHYASDADINFIPLPIPRIFEFLNSLSLIPQNITFEMLCEDTPNIYLQDCCNTGSTLKKAMLTSPNSWFSQLYQAVLNILAVLQHSLLSLFNLNSNTKPIQTGSGSSDSNQEVDLFSSPNPNPKMSFRTPTTSAPLTKTPNSNSKMSKLDNSSNLFKTPQTAGVGTMGQKFLSAVSSGEKYRSRSGSMSIKRSKAKYEYLYEIPLARRPPPSDSLRYGIEIDEYLPFHAFPIQEPIESSLQHPSNFMIRDNTFDQQYIQTRKHNIPLVEALAAHFGRVWQSMFYLLSWPKRIKRVFQGHDTENDNETDTNTVDSLDLDSSSNSSNSNSPIYVPPLTVSEQKIKTQVLIHLSTFLSLFTRWNFKCIPFHLFRQISLNGLHLTSRLFSFRHSLVLSQPLVAKSTVPRSVHYPDFSKSEPFGITLLETFDILLDVFPASVKSGSGPVSGSSPLSNGIPLSMQLYILEQLSNWFYPVYLISDSQFDGNEQTNSSSRPRSQWVRTISHLDDVNLSKIEMTLDAKHPVGSGAGHRQRHGRSHSRSHSQNIDLDADEKNSPQILINMFQLSRSSVWKSEAFGKPAAITLLDSLVNKFVPNLSLRLQNQFLSMILLPGIQCSLFVPPILSRFSVLKSNPLPVPAPMLEFATHCSAVCMDLVSKTSTTTTYPLLSTTLEIIWPFFTEYSKTCLKVGAQDLTAIITTLLNSIHSWPDPLLKRFLMSKSKNSKLSVYSLITLCILSNDLPVSQELVKIFSRFENWFLVETHGGDYGVSLEPEPDHEPEHQELNRVDGDGSNIPVIHLTHDGDGDDISGDPV